MSHICHTLDVTHMMSHMRCHTCSQSHMNEPDHTRIHRHTRTSHITHICTATCEGAASRFMRGAAVAGMGMSRALQYTAIHCNTLQSTATRCNTLQYTAKHCNTLQYTAIHCKALQHAAIRAHARAREEERVRKWAVTLNARRWCGWYVNESRHTCE